MKLMKICFAAAAVLLMAGVFSASSALELNGEVCRSYINMYCIRCHTIDRVCEGVKVKNETQWQETIKLMAEYGKLDKDVQETVFSCVTAAETGKYEVCGNATTDTKPAAAEKAAGKQPAEQAAGTFSPEKIFRSIGPVDALKMLQERDDVVFLDVRTPKERSYGAIPGSKLVPILDLVNGKIPLPKDKPILLVCAVGGRSYVAAQVLSKNGYQEVYNLSGGVKGWYQAGLPLAHDEGPVSR